jgi:hypothetical protein
MSYQGMDALNKDPAFGGRVWACAVEQAYNTYKNDSNLDVVALANDVMRGSGGALTNFTRFVAAAPGLADKADDGSGGVDQTKIVDGDILAAVDASWPTIAGLYFDAQGNRVA